MTISTIFSQTKKELKELEKIEDFENNKSIVNSGKFCFKPTWATPRNGESVNIINDKGILTIEDNNLQLDLFHIAKDSAQSRLVGHNKITKYNVNYNEKKKRIIITFSVRINIENLDMRLKIFGKREAELSVTNLNRNSIYYFGDIFKLY